MNIQQFGHDRTQTAYDHLAALRADLATLTDLRGAGPIRRTTGWGPSPDQITAAGARHTAERADAITQMRAGLAPIGASPAPADLTVLDTLRDVEADLAELLAACLDRVAPSITPARTSPRRIGQLITLLPKIGSVDDLLDHLTTETRRMHRRVKHALGDTEEVRQLAERCPHCGAKSLRALMDRGVVVCGNAACRCQDDQCGCHHPDRPRRHQWTTTELLEPAA